MEATKYNPAHDYYDILGVESDAATDAIKAAHRILARKFHPDIAGADFEERFKDINQAWDVLKDSSLRQEYDFEREQHFLNRPPILRLSTSKVDFGTVADGEVGLTHTVLIYNDGGDAECQIVPEAGEFWSVSGEVADDDAAWGQLVFTLDAAGLKPGLYQQEVKILLDNGEDTSVKRVTVTANVTAVASATSNATKPSSASSTTAPPRTTYVAPVRPVAPTPPKVSAPSSPPADDSSRSPGEWIYWLFHSRIGGILLMGLAYVPAIIFMHGRSSATAEQIGALGVISMGCGGLLFFYGLFRLLVGDNW
jgi:hypothetical protein